MIVFLLVLTATFHPAAPTVGDPVTIDFRQPVVLDPSARYEIVRQQGTRVVVRTFRPEPVALSGRAGPVVFRNLVLPVRSVLKPNDKLDPAPLRPPLPQPYPRRPFVLIAGAAACAVAAWAAAWMLARRPSASASTQPSLSPAERFRAAVDALRAGGVPMRWAALADATRLYLASLSPHLGVELTTSQLLPRLDDHAAGVVAQILRQGDLEKFSPWGAPPADFDAAAAEALELIPPPPQEAAA